MGRCATSSTCTTWRSSIVSRPPAVDVADALPPLATTTPSTIRTTTTSSTIAACCHLKRMRLRTLRKKGRCMKCRLRRVMFELSKLWVGCMLLRLMNLSYRQDLRLLLYWYYLHMPFPHYLELVSTANMATIARLSPNTNNVMLF